MSTHCCDPCACPLCCLSARLYRCLGLSVWLCSAAVVCGASLLPVWKQVGDVQFLSRVLHRAARPTGAPGACTLITFRFCGIERYLDAVASAHPAPSSLSRQVGCRVLLAGACLVGRHVHFPISMCHRNVTSPKSPPHHRCRISQTCDDYRPCRAFGSLPPSFSHPCRQGVM